MGMLMNKSADNSTRLVSGFRLPRDLLQQFDAVRAPTESSATLPPRAYSDMDIFELEQHRLFRRLWVGIGRADRWSKAGDYSELDVAGVPVIILRDSTGELRAFANSCRHRGAKLLSGTGNCKVIRCPFHRWTYALDGRLLTASAMHKTPAFDPTEYGLVPVRVDTEAGFAFLCLDPETAHLEDWLGDFSTVHAPWSLPDMISTRRREFEVNCNWKSFLEVFNEYYHLPYVHPGTLSGLYNTPLDLDAVAGKFVTQFGTTEGTGALLEEDQNRSLPKVPGMSSKAESGTRYTWLFPNMTFAAGRESIWVYEVCPLAPDRTRVGMTVCFPRETTAIDNFEQRVEAYYRRMDIALDEDIPALENQQRGLSSPLARQGMYSCLEPSVAAFAHWYADTILDRG